MTTADRVPKRLASNWMMLGRAHGLKRAGDLAAALLAMPLVVCALGILAPAIYLDSPGPILFLDKRLGLGGRPFTCLKLRTMVTNGDAVLERYFRERPDALREWRVFRKLKGFDPRVTRVGRVLRRLSLDELPQLFNVLAGDMSLVGPRPYLISERDLMGEYVERILAAKPGVTGLWQVSGRNELPFEERLKLDLAYVEHWSLWLDTKILAKTVVTVLAHKGAF